MVVVVEEQTSQSVREMSASVVVNGGTSLIQVGDDQGRDEYGISVRIRRKYEYRNRNRNRNEEGQKSSYRDRNRVSVMTSILFLSLSLRGIFVG